MVDEVAVVADEDGAVRLVVDVAVLADDVEESTDVVAVDETEGADVGDVAVVSEAVDDVELDGDGSDDDSAVSLRMADAWMGSLSLSASTKLRLHQATVADTAVAASQASA